MTREYLIRLPWPSKTLSSNARAHWAKLAKEKAAARHTAFVLARAQGVQASAGVTLEFTFYPPDKRRRDAHNMPHMLKAAIDGIADAMGTDDNGFRCVFPSSFAEPVKGGAVLVHVRGQADED